MKTSGSKKEGLRFMIDQERLTKQFLDFVRVDSPFLPKLLLGKFWEKS